MSAIGMVGFGALGLLVLLWLAVSFSQAGPRRERLEWLAATCMYVALLMLFTHLTSRALAEDNSVALVAFGFLAVLFGSGLVVSLYNTVVALLGAGGSGASSATN